MCLQCKNEHGMSVAEGDVLVTLGAGDNRRLIPLIAKKRAAR